ncbi:MAG TPA: GGDEF domain-containing protein [Methylophilaceae bacterium]|nr:GGDEF domain-containing protein [Methylophilaceae bacterium]
MRDMTQATDAPHHAHGSTPIDIMARADRLELLYHQSFPALFVSVFVAILLCAMLWQQVSIAALLAWFAITCFAALFRLTLFVAYFREKPCGKNLLKWEKPYFITLILSSLIWGVGALMVTPGDSLLYQAVTFFILVGMAGGAISTYSAFRYMAIGAMLSVLVPATAWLILQPHVVQKGMAVGAIIFMVVSVRAASIISQALHKSFLLSRELSQAKDLYESLAKIDPLTALNNRRAFFDHGQQLISYCERSQHPVSAIVLDADHFKQINDRHGHAVGDAALQNLAGIMKNTLRKSDVVGRLGGEEFGVLLPDTTINAASLLAEKLRKTIAETPVSFQGQQFPLTVSLGVSSGAYDAGVLLQRADAALYRAKRQGRNCVVSQDLE